MTQNNLCEYHALSSEPIKQIGTTYGSVVTYQEVEERMFLKKFYIINPES